MAAGEPRRVRWRAAVWASAVGLAALGAMITWKARGQPALDVTTASAGRGTIVRRILSAGTLQAVRTVDVGVQVSGTVQSLGADFNSIVRANQVIARLDPSLFQGALDQARASLQQAQAAFAQALADLLGLQTAERDARTQLTRAQALASKELIARADLDAVQILMDAATDGVHAGEASVQQATAAIAVARAGVHHAEIDLDHTVIRSPIDGIILVRNVDVGQTVAAAVQAPVLFTIAADLRRLQIQVNVDESDVGGLQTGQTVTFQVEPYGEEMFSGAVSQIRLQPIPEQTTTATTVASSTLPQTTTNVATVVSYAVMIDVENQAERLRPGMTALLELPGLRRENVLRIPNSVLTFRPPPEVLKAIGESEPPFPADRALEAGADARPREVWRYDGKRFTPAAVHIGLSDGQWTEVLAGAIMAGDPLVTMARLAR